MVSDPSCISYVPPQPQFWAYQAKDAITGVIALVALITSSTGLWVAYLRPRKVRCDVGDAMRISYGGHSKRKVKFMADAYAINTGARPGVITRMTIRVWRSGFESSPLELYWREITKSEDITTKGSGRRVWTTFAGFASAVLVPKYDSRLIEGAFISEADFQFEENETYSFQLACWIDGAKAPIFGNIKQFTISPTIYRFLRTRATLNDLGIVERHLYLTSDDGQIFTARDSTTWIPDESVSEDTALAILEKERTGD